LSYRWGEPPPPKALLSNIKSLEEGIPFDSLPKTFRDAVMVTRSINVRYIWIDSLCIVQDDPDELKREIAKMGNIYEGSTLTIGATHSENTTQGLFLPRQPVKSVQLPTVSADIFIGSASTSVYIRLPFMLSDCSPDSGHLAKRAWCFQEHLLSRRYVSFTMACLVWQCRTLGEDETGLPESLRRIYSRRGWPEWALIVEQYSKRDMTTPDDKLNALAGYVHACGDAWNRGLYFNGVWADHYP
ncbi:heterokaryon incompatibility protein-domain-containing protein, partial [Bisporella sp. PMI_857]